MRTRLLSLLALLLAFTLVAAACGDDDDPVSSDDSEESTDESGSDDEVAEGSTVLDLAVDAGQFSTLIAAVEAAGLEETLAGEGPFTVLAPTDAAFDEALAALGLTAEELLASESLADILTYHVLPQEAPSELVATLDGQSVPTVNGQDVAISVVDGQIMVDAATVVQADLEADNGIVHVINAVLLPPDVAEALGAGMADEDMTDEGSDEGASDEPGTIVDVAVESGEFPTLVAALQATGLDEVLSGDGPFTVFAPTEDAFAAALDALGVTAEDLLADPGLADILTYHVLPVDAPAEVVVTLDGQDVETVNGATVLVTVADDGVMVNDANVVTTDIFASNGTIHVIDSVLLPPS